MKKKKYLKKVGVPMKKRVVGHRVISFLLCVLMLFGTVPLTFAAIDPIVPDNDTRFPVIRYREKFRNSLYSESYSRCF